MIQAIMQQAVDTKTNITAIGTGLTAVPGQFYRTTDTNEYAYGAMDGSLVWFNDPSNAPVQGVDSTETVNLSLTDGVITAVANVSAASDNDIATDGAGLYSKKYTVAAGSAEWLEIDAATNQLSITARGMTDVYVDASADFATFASTVYDGSNYQESDTVIIPATGEAYIHNGGTAGTAADFTLINAPNLTASAVRAFFSSGNAAIDYNAADGIFTFTLDPASDGAGSITANGLLIDTSAGAVTDTHDVLGGGAVEVTLQTLLDALAGQSDITELQVHADTGDFILDAANNDYTIKGGTLLKTAADSNYNVVVDFDTAGGSVGNVVALVDDGNGGLIPAYSTISFLANNGLTYNTGTNEFELGGNLNRDTDITVGDHYLKFNKGDIRLEVNNSDFDDPGNGDLNVSNIAFRGSDAAIGIQEEGGEQEIKAYAYGDASSEMRIVSDQFKITNYGDGSSELKMAEGRTDFKVSKELRLNTPSTGMQSGDFDAITNGKLLQKTSYDDNGTIRHTVDYSPFAMPTTAGTSGQVLTVDANGNIVYGSAQSPLTANNGINIDNDVIQLGGDLVENTTVNGAGFALNMPGYSSMYLADTDENNTISLDTAEINIGAAATGGIVAVSANEAINIGAKNVTLSSSFGAGDIKIATASSFANDVTGRLLQSADANGVVEYSPFAMPTTAGTNGQVLTVDANGNVVFTSPAVATAYENGLIEGAGVVKWGGDLTQNTSIDLNGNELTWNGNAGQEMKSHIDMRFMTAASGPVLTAADGTKWRVGVTSFSNGAATLSLESVA